MPPHIQYIPSRVNSRDFSRLNALRVLGNRSDIIGPGKAYAGRVSGSKKMGDRFHQGLEMAAAQGDERARNILLHGTGRRKRSARHAKGAKKPAHKKRR